MSIKGIIYYESSFEKANEELKKMVDRYNQKHIPVTKCHYMRHGSWAKFENGDTWRVLYANDCARGYKWNIAYIERSINLDTYRCIIAPAAIDFPFAATRLWGEGNLHLDFNQPLPF
jgi:hypothetical protein